jgi:hypothetical protein
MDDLEILHEGGYTTHNFGFHFSKIAGHISNIPNIYGTS